MNSLRDRQGFSYIEIVHVYHASKVVFDHYSDLWAMQMIAVLVTNAVKS